MKYKLFTVFSLVTAVCGVVSAIDFTRTMIAGAASGFYTYIDAIEGGASKSRAFLSGVASAYGTICIGGLPSSGAMTAGVGELNLAKVADAASDSVKFYMAMHHAVGTMYGNMAQLEAGDAPSRCNLIEDTALHLCVCEN